MHDPERRHDNAWHCGKRKSRILVVTEKPRKGVGVYQQMISEREQGYRGRNIVIHVVYEPRGKLCANEVGNKNVRNMIIKVSKGCPRMQDGE
jgi:hypothetical protein